MIIPDVAHLACITPRSAYIDFKSFEESTGITKAKYKLLTKRLAGVYFFHILTKTESTHPLEYRIKILKNDWESRETHQTGTHLDAECSYLGCQHVHMMNENEVLSKRKDSANGFHVSGVLSQTKFTEVTESIKRSGGVFSRKSDETIQKDIDSVYNKGVISEHIKNKLGL
jgi:hypothetical protein